jgi:hypothetical protein
MKKIKKSRPKKLSFKIDAVNLAADFIAASPDGTRFIIDEVQSVILLKLLNELSNSRYFLGQIKNHINCIANRHGGYTQ